MKVPPASMVGFGEAAAVGATAVVGWLTSAHPLLLSPIGPWDFSWLGFLATSLALLWFFRGWRISGAPHLPCWRCALFLLGIGSIYAVLLTQFEYIAQHLFFLNRVQHLVMHHLGPFMVALSWPGATIRRGMPASLRSWPNSSPVQLALRGLQQPVVALVLFEGLLMLWLVPPIAFRAMFDWRLYAVMNASMVIDGLLFWFLVLDPRPAPPAKVTFFTRLTLAFVVIFPQIAVGTLIGTARSDLYPAFTLCGRVYPGIGPLLDQQIGGMVLWVPAGMMSALAAVLIMWRMFVHDDHMARMHLGLARGAGP